MLQAEAIGWLRSAVVADASLVAAVEALDSLLNHTVSTSLRALQQSKHRAGQVDRWHFRMLNDKARNEAYASAIQAAVARRAAAGVPVSV